MIDTGVWKALEELNDRVSYLENKNTAHARTKSVPEDFSNESVEVSGDTEFIKLENIENILARMLTLMEHEHNVVFDKEARRYCEESVVKEDTR